MAATLIDRLIEAKYAGFAAACLRCGRGIMPNTELPHKCNLERELSTAAMSYGKACADVDDSSTVAAGELLLSAQLYYESRK